MTMKTRNLLLLLLLLAVVSSCWKMDNPLDPEVNANLKVASPIFHPDGGTYPQGQTVTITCASSGATIRYTTDGAEPGSNSAIYTGPVSVQVPATIKAKAFKNGWPDSQTSTASYTLQAATPTFSPVGGVYNNNINLSINCATVGATIRYTIDGSEPDATSTLYSTPISVTGITTIKAKAFKIGWPDSQMATANYTFQVAPPTFNPPGGTYTAQQSVTISCPTIGATIRYTTDGSDPTESSAQYTNPVTLTNTTTLNARAYKAGWVSSQTATATYVMMPSNFVLVSGGTFNNGTSNVTLSSFYIDKYEVTQTSYQSVMGTNPSYFTGVANGPVERVSWFDAIEYCNRRSLQEGLPPCYSYSTYGTNPANWPSGWNTDNANHTNVSCSWTANGYRLPTEMEWMFAAKGGNQSIGYIYSGSNTVGNVAWYYSNAGNRTHDVGELTSNELGTFDMSGNVWEWVWDIYGTYPSGSQNNPTGASSGSNRVKRGGSWIYNAVGCTVSYRSSYSATYGYNGLGFRCVRVSP